MTTTPTIWKSAFDPNGGSQFGNQSASQSIGLASGNILVVWQDDSDSTRPFTDIIGQILSPEGAVISPNFQVNASVWAGDETGPKIVALPDGGFAMAYGGYLEAIGGFITVERFNSAGQALFYNIITDELGSLTDFWEITADSSGNYTLVFERHSPDIDVHSITYDNLTNAVGPERTNLAQNSSDIDHLGAVAAFANGHILTFTNELDHLLIDPSYETAEFTIVDPVTGTQLRNTEIAGSSNHLTSAFAEDAAVLTGGQFVLVYSTNFYEYIFKVVLGEGGSVGEPVHIPAEAAPLGGIHVVALQDGGFFIAWLEPSSHTLYGQRYGAYGDAIGEQLLITGHVGSFAPNDLSLAADGRILVAFKNQSGEISEVILDPRDNVINGTAAADTITTQNISTFIDGRGGNDLLFGQGGNDSMHGGPGFDTLRGGKGGDTFYLYDVTLNDEFDRVIELPNGGIDTVHVGADELDPNILYFYKLVDEVENGVVDGGAGLDLSGNSLENRLTGNSATNFFFGLGGNDRLDGGGGADSLFGGGGDDVYLLYDTTGSPAFLSYDTVVEGIDAGEDAVQINSNAPNLGGYALSENVENGAVVGGGVFNLTGNNLANSLTGNARANTLSGSAGKDVLTGGGGSDILLGGNGKDILDGGNDNDILVGGGGNDKLLGGAGADRIKGGDGNDTFAFATLTDSGAFTDLRDVITDFTSDPAAGAAFIDRISALLIDARASAGGHQDFTFIKAAAFSAEGQIRAFQSKDNTVVQFNTFGAGGAEMAIVLLDFTATALTASDFVL